MGYTEQLQQQLRALRNQIKAVDEDARRLQKNIDRYAADTVQNPLMNTITEQANSLCADLQAAHDESEVIFEQVTQLGELIHVAALITSSLELDEVLAGVLDTVISLIGAERASIWLRPVDGFEFKSYAARDSNKHNLDQDSLPVSQQMIQAAVDAEQPLVTTNASQDKRFDKLESVVLNELRSVIVIPLILRGRVLGVLYADNRVSQGVFSEENFPILTAFANQAAIAIGNARLFEQIRGYLRETHQELLRMSIHIDEDAVAAKVSQITDSDIFKKLRNLRQDPSQSRRDDPD
jgi:signal transduction protein with GAF and PtsI domain